MILCLQDIYVAFNFLSLIHENSAYCFEHFVILISSFCDAVRAILYASGVVQPKRKSKPADLTTAKISRTDAMYSQMA